MNASKLVDVVRRYLWLFILAGIIAGLTTYFVLNRQPEQYEAQTRILVGPTVDSPSPDLNSLKIGSQLMQTYADVVTTRPFLQAVNNKLDQKINLETLAGMIDTKQNVDARILTITVQSQDPKQAAAIANAVADALVEISPSKDNSTAALRAQITNQTQEIEKIINSSQANIQDLEAKLVALGSVTPKTPEDVKAVQDQQSLLLTQLTEERSRMSDALRTMTTIYQVLQSTNTNQVQVVEPADAVVPLDQNLPLRAAASALAGLVLVMVIMIAFEYYDDTIRAPGDFPATAGVPLLSSIDRYNRSGVSGRDQVMTLNQPKSEAANDYRTAVAKLLYTISNSMPSSFLLSSVGSRSSNNTAVTAANLGVAFAQAGYRVILVDAQFHNPALTELFGAKDKPGLYELLTAKSSELKLITLQEMSDIRFLPAGLLSENWSGAILNSGNIIKRLEELQKDADVVLVAGPSTTEFAQGLTLASQVTGVVLVGQYGDVHRKMINEVAESLKSMDIQVAGIIFEKNPTASITKRLFKRTAPATGVTASAKSSQIEHTTTSPVEKTNLP